MSSTTLASVKADDDILSRINKLKLQILETPANPNLHQLLGNLLCKLGDVDNARKHYQLAIDNWDKSKKANDYVNLAITYLDNDNEKMVELLRLALKDNDENIPANCNMAAYYMTQNKWNKARPYIMKAFNLSRLLVILDAVSSHQEKVQLASTVSPYYFRATLYEHDGDIEKALEYAAIAAKISPESFGNYHEYLKRKV